MSSRFDFRLNGREVQSPVGRTLALAAAVLIIAGILILLFVILLPLAIIVAAGLLVGSIYFKLRSGRRSIAGRGSDRDDSLPPLDPSMKIDDFASPSSTSDRTGTELPPRVE